MSLEIRRQAHISNNVCMSRDPHDFNYSLDRHLSRLLVPEIVPLDNIMKSLVVVSPAEI